ncbi:AsmA family protein [Roseomonas sp. JC162]|uniref:AsmA family protein n=1 Tax=Neoroseomonas marina TaxID=1232220 RepID=A0A848ELE1_9PROT|nr:AsmA family protein [Neoroseomonas marina]
MSRRLLLLFLGLPLALLGLAWFAPRLLDWEAQRLRVAAIAEARLGRPVGLGGPLRVTFLPQPMVEASRVHVGTPDGNGLGITARALRLRLGLLPLLLGRLEPRDLVLVGADVRLPWPPETIGALRPPPWLTDFDARIESSRVSVGGAVFEGVAARLAAPGPLDAVRIEGSFTWRSAPVRFQAVVGRPGHDGVATLDVVLGVTGASASARGVLVAEGGFEGRVEASGSDIAALFAAPSGAFRATGRLAVTGELAAADDLALDIAGVTGRGAATFRFAPEPRLDVALALARLDLDAWVAALRRAPQPPLPMGLDLSAEVAAFHGATLRGLRGGVMREGDRLVLSNISTMLPGEAQLTASGSAQGGRLELTGQVSGPSLRATLAAFGVPVDRFAATRLRAFEGTGRVDLDAAQLAVPELAGMVDGARLSGAGVLRFGVRPVIAAGLTFDHLDLDGLLPTRIAPLDALRAAPGMDVNLRLAAESIAWAGVRADRASLDAAVDQGRLTIRRAAARLGEDDVSLAGTIAFGATPRFTDVALDLGGGTAGGVARALLPNAGLSDALLGQPLRVRIAGTGPADALAVTAEGELGELRLAGQANLVLGQGRGTGSVTLRHPGAPRLAFLLGAPEPPEWLGEGSLSLVATLAVAPDNVTTENLELVAGGLRARGQLALALDGARPRLTGRLAADRLPLPGLPGREAPPLVLAPIGRIDADVAVEAVEVVTPDLPVLQAFAARLTIEEGRAVLDGLRAGLGGGRLDGRLALDAMAQPPVVSGALGLTGATLTGPLFGTPIDIASGQLDAQGRFTASGHGASALLSTLTGEGRFAIANGVLGGVALAGAASAAALDDGVAAEQGVREALEGGATAVDRLTGGWRTADGEVSLEGVGLAAEGGATGTIEGRIDIVRGALDLRLAVQPPGDGAPPIALRVTGPAEAPRRQPEVAPWARWRAER